MSLSVWMNLGTKLYVLRKTVAQASNALVHFRSSTDDAVVNKQYDNGKPVLLYSPRIVYSSRCFELVLSMVLVIR
jgi:hypothetical protein